MAWIPKMQMTGPVVALVAAVLDSRDGAGRERAREMGNRIGGIVMEDVADYITTQAFVAAALAELAAEAMGRSPEEVLAVVLEAGMTGENQNLKGK